PSPGYRLRCGSESFHDQPFVDYLDGSDVKLDDQEEALLNIMKQMIRSKDDKDVLTLEIGRALLVAYKSQNLNKKLLLQTILGLLAEITEGKAVFEGLQLQTLLADIKHPKKSFFVGALTIASAFITAIVAFISPSKFLPIDPLPLGVGVGLGISTQVAADAYASRVNSSVDDVLKKRGDTYDLIVRVLVDCARETIKEIEQIEIDHVLKAAINKFGEKYPDPDTSRSVVAPPEKFPNVAEGIKAPLLQKPAQPSSDFSGFFYVREWDRGRSLALP
ncbi:MAG: hypothetical protein V4591_02330, partial [Bdellovibrionota bacterium]